MQTIPLLSVLLDLPLFLSLLYMLLPLPLPLPLPLLPFHLLLLSPLPLYATVHLRIETTLTLNTKAIGSWGPQQGLASADSELLGTVDRTDGLAAFLKSCEIAMDHHLGVFKNAGVTNLKSLKVLAGWPAQDQAEIF